MDIRIPKPAMRVTIDVPPALTSGSGTPTTGTRPVTMAVFTNITDSRLASVNFSEKSFALQFALAVRDYVIRQTAEQVRAPLEKVLDRSREVGEGEIQKPEEVTSSIRQALDSMDQLTNLAQLTEADKDTSSNVALAGILETSFHLLESIAQRAEVGIAVRTSPEAPEVEVANYTFHRICFALGLLAIDKCRAGSDVLLTLESEDNGTGFMLSAIVNAESDISTRQDSIVQSRALLEHLVAAEGGVLSIAETKANGTLKIMASFDPSKPSRSGSEGKEVAKETSNILQLPSTGTSD